MKKYIRHKVIIYTRSLKDAKELYQKIYKKPYNPNATDAHIDIEGHLTILNVNYKIDFDLQTFWTKYGYYPVLIGRSYFKKKYFNKIIKHSLRFIQE